MTKKNRIQIKLNNYVRMAGKTFRALEFELEISQIKIHTKSTRLKVFGQQILMVRGRSISCMISPETHRIEAREGPGAWACLSCPQRGSGERSEGCKNRGVCTGEGP